VTRRLVGNGLLTLAILIVGACAGARVDPPFSPEPRLEATIESLSEELARLRLERDSLTASSDSLRGEIARLQRELQRIKAIDLRPRRPKPE
jgi:hypothetical protein